MSDGMMMLGHAVKRSLAALGVFGVMNLVDLNTQYRYKVFGVGSRMRTEDGSRAGGWG